MIIQVEHVSKSYGAMAALEDVSFAIEGPEIFGLVGPNGAGKTTLIEIIEGLRRPDSGYVRIMEMDPIKDRVALAPRLGIQLQESALQDRIKVWEAVDLFASFYPQTVDRAQLLASLGLTEHVNVAFAKLSGGQKQRLFVALALISDPSVVFLDELTTGLDPQARRATWDLVRGIRDQGKTVFLTTHYMEEAEALCNRVAIIDKGRIIRIDTPPNLFKDLDLEISITFNANKNAWTENLKYLRNVSRVEVKEGQICVYGHGDSLLSDLMGFLHANNIPFTDLNIREPNFEDVFLSLTGKAVR